MRRKVPEIQPSDLTLLRQDITHLTAAVTSLREESRLAHQGLSNLLKRHAERLDEMEPIVGRLDALRQKGWGALSALSLALFILVGGASSGFRWIFMKVGIILP